MRVTLIIHFNLILQNYTLHQQTLGNVHPAKYLGITITENMEQGQHISDVLSKASETLSVFKFAMLSFYKLFILFN